eukprot:TRINITY_DN12090_c0_g1_i1.p1 TRINITY_DN12090_c0_g1~~TRINITY_DN12090_c0_g1_i1.p1  ORF type:complete len:305 (-),score=58.15 TRINITY_DN12090_c0_g1_i1:440-1354(-)
MIPHIIRVLRTSTGARCKFHYTDTMRICNFLQNEPGIRWSRDLQAIVGRDAQRNELYRVKPPIAYALRDDVQSLADYQHQLSVEPPLSTYMVTLLQAGAAAMGIWRESELLAHKAIKKYVVRGTGSAQPTYLKTKGKSRYGSRLRLINARTILDDINEKLHEFVDKYGQPQHVWYHAPVRMWPTLHGRDPPPPFEQRGENIRPVPLNVNRPCFAELKRIQDSLTHGWVHTNGDGAVSAAALALAEGSGTSVDELPLGKVNPRYVETKDDEDDFEEDEETDEEESEVENRGTEEDSSDDDESPRV